MDEFPTPQDVIGRVSANNHLQAMPQTLTLADAYGREMFDAEHDVDNEHDVIMNMFRPKIFRLIITPRMIYQLPTVLPERMMNPNSMIMMTYLMTTILTVAANPGTNLVPGTKLTRMKNISCLSGLNQLERLQCHRRRLWQFRSRRRELRWGFGGRSR
jgi:hypothetical protein